LPSLEHFHDLQKLKAALTVARIYQFLQHMAMTALWLKEIRTQFLRNFTPSANAIIGQQAL
jgi:hypothetical protein